ncbi:MAG: bifunctional 3-phosphoshikimate 1-carboxyvinyltransferase/cytidylate kinase [Gammaproteobacteria bacterium]|uniref:bifunctional 3-phosphoshikimate 1-carboxyvinyltransferase/cytidylate kinase n=1 Tax=Hydrogenophaga sp. TaxID=1904254 RepID=UPI0025C66AF8|nr:bifunctional 3-phosphoshikimate 1-carboxyvinyltransferase/cytidylate kinase [Hydrogenophaga sp.]MBU4184556.1 bifunctional 3-phosphoshikimate 1-carboxyvinyltransferase/cytidylate kinase [Gammaproteobacteria bacterium]MBU4281898.1 bifunctional 3-phosphoshikimate 1-carboxyvinyltransferase/cytidylate kinase [Gammaproteobacteria bacterium]MBU4507609.1 bifunctional 3-phosphoshikimate 1-carboxyvinyltransferase/cytidylate kinase [Gammaproteobacteria bacterium]MCG2655254.1 bifunctional 3-phosphoshiki
MYAIDHLDVPPLRSAGGTVRLPGSKSISNRVLLLAALSVGYTDIADLLDSDDTRVMLAALAQLGCRIEPQADGALRVHGLGGALPVKQAQLFLGNAGTAMRPLTAALALLASVHGGAFELSGIARMHERPIGDLVDALRQLGCPVDCLGQEGYPPLRLGNETPQTLALDQPIRVRGDVSSQFLTALLLALPLVATNHAPTLGTGVSSLQPEGAVPSWGGPTTGRDIVIEVVGELISRPYIEITLNLLERFGVSVRRDGWQRFTIPAGSRYTSPGRIPVEGDASSASYFIALGALASPTPGSDGITIEGVGLSSIQGDIRFVEAARLMGADISGEANRLHIRRGAWPLKAIDLDCNHIPDAAMTLAVMALFADGTTTLRNIASWRVKETDRIAAMATECRKFGATVEEGADFIRITPPRQRPAAGPPQGGAAPLGGSEPHEVGSVGAHGWTTGSIHTYDDHRVAMCFSLAAFNPAGLPVRIEDPKCVAKTFPDYFETLFEVCQTPAQAIPVICIDGPTASGKGTLASEVAQRLGYQLLDSGALYRATALAAQDAGVDLDDEPALARLAAQLPLAFRDHKVFLGGRDITDPLRLESTGGMASRVSQHLAVRSALHALQLSFRRLPGLVADGRDMGTVIFPDAPLKVYLTASAEQRAQRRHKQLISKGIAANIDSLLADLKMRDHRDSSRAHAPLKPAVDALLLDNSELGIEQSVQQVLNWWQGKTVFSET